MCQLVRSDQIRFFLFFGFWCLYRRENKSAAWKDVRENINISAYENVRYCDLKSHNIDERKNVKNYQIKGSRLKQNGLVIGEELNGVGVKLLKKVKHGVRKRILETSRGAWD